MVCAKSKKQMGLVVLFLILLTLLLSTTPCLAGKSRFHSFKAASASASASRLKPFQSPRVGKGNKNNKDGDQDIFGADKRKVYTGPNPLHNR